MNDEVTKPKNSKGRLALWLLLAFIVLLIVVLILLKGSKPPPERETTPERATSVQVQTVQARTIDHLITLPARLESWQDITVPCEKAGLVSHLAADKGDTVQEGDLLLQIDPRIWQDHLRKTEIDLREAEKDMERWENLHSSGAVSHDDYDQYASMLDLARLALDEAQINLSKCSVTSPISGFVNNRYIDQGEFINEGAAAFQIVQLDRMKLIIELPEQYIMSCTFGMELPFTISGLPGTVFTGTVSFISAQAAADSHAFQLEATVDNPDGLLKAGLIATTELSLGQIQDAIVVPLASVIPDKGDYVAYTANNNRAERRIVKIDSIRGHEAILADGLYAGDELIVTGQRAITDGAYIAPEPPDSE